MRVHKEDQNGFLPGYHWKKPIAPENKIAGKYKVIKDKKILKAGFSFGDPGYRFNMNRMKGKNCGNQPGGRNPQKCQNAP